MKVYCFLSVSYFYSKYCFFFFLIVMHSICQVYTYIFIMTTDELLRCYVYDTGMSCCKVWISFYYAFLYIIYFNIPSYSSEIHLVHIPKIWMYIMVYIVWTFECTVNIGLVKSQFSINSGIYWFRYMAIWWWTSLLDFLSDKNAQSRLLFKT